MDRHDAASGIVDIDQRSSDQLAATVVIAHNAYYVKYGTNRISGLSPSQHILKSKSGLDDPAPNVFYI